MTNKKLSKNSTIRHFFLGLALFIALVSTSQKVFAAVVPIPVGCPGSATQGPATAANLKVCASIPVGCPGSTQQGPASPGQDTSTCPYGVEKTPDATSDATTSGQKGLDCSAQAANPKATCDVALDCNKGTDAARCGITAYLVRFINILSALVGVTVVGVLVFSGIQYSASGGNPNAATAARKRVANALLALVVFAFMYAFLQWVVPGGVL